MTDEPMVERLEPDYSVDGNGNRLATVNADAIDALLSQLREQRERAERAEKVLAEIADYECTLCGGGGCEHDIAAGYWDAALAPDTEGTP